jgi:hypothetical protein
MSEPFSKKRAGKTETIVGIGVLFVLSFIAVSVYFVQFDYNPAVLAVQDQTDPDAPLAGAQTRSLTAFFPVSDEFSPLTPSEQFDSETLSDKINGKAELYLSAGFADLQCQRFFLKDQPDVWLEVFVYEMADHTKAFSVFSSQRREDAQIMDMTAHAYQTGNAVFLTHGNYYVEVISSSAADAGIGAAVSLAEQWVAHTQIGDEMTAEISEIDLFPKKDLVENSVRLLSANVFGYDRFQDIFTAAYHFEEDHVTAFISRRQTPEEARDLADGYYQFLTSFGGRDVTPETDPTRRIILIMDVYICIFAQDRFLAGVHEAPTSDIADHLSLALMRHLTEAFYE